MVMINNHNVSIYNLRPKFEFTNTSKWYTHTALRSQAGSHYKNWLAVAVIIIDRVIYLNGILYTVATGE